MTEKWEVECECASCGGTGIYRGMGECDGAGVECSTCKGTGKSKIKVAWKPFTRKKRRCDVDVVFKSNCGFGLSPSIQGGMKYEDWASGKAWPKRGHEIRALACPAWYYQTEDYSRRPDWDECIGCGSFSDCKNFKNKAACWERFDREKL